MSTPTRGSCYGFAIVSEEPLRYTRDGGGEPLTIGTSDERVRTSSRPLLAWRRPTHPYRASMYRDGDVFRLWIGGGGWYSIEPAAGRITMPGRSDPLRREERLWGIPALLCFRRRGDLPVHAAAVETPGGAVLLAGPRMAGKTTLAAAFHRGGYRVLAEDLACVRLGPAPAVIPGPAMLRVRHDVASGLGLAIEGAHARTKDRVHVAIESSRRGDCAPVPLAGVVFLREGDRTRMEAADVHEAVRDLWGLNFRLPDDAERASSFSSIADVVSHVPVWNLRRPMTLDALDDAVASVADRCAAVGAAP